MASIEISSHSTCKVSYDLDNELHLNFAQPGPNSDSEIIELTSKVICAMSIGQAIEDLVAMIFCVVDPCSLSFKYFETILIVYRNCL